MPLSSAEITANGIERAKTLPQGPLKRHEVRRERCGVWERLGYAPEKVHVEWRNDEGAVAERGFYFDEKPPDMTDQAKPNIPTVQLDRLSQCQ